jgi:hypothetical protein
MKKKSTSAKSFSNGNVLIAANDPLIANLLVDAISIMDLFAGVVKLSSPKIEKILPEFSKVCLIISAFDNNQDNFEFTRAIFAEELGSFSKTPAPKVWTTLAISAEEKLKVKKLGVDLIIPRPFLIEKVVEEIIKVIKIS